MIASSSTAALALVELPSLPLGRRDVRVAVRAIGVNPVDWKLGDIPGAGLVHAALGPAGRFVRGIDFAGVVTELGADAQGIALGDRVVGGVSFSRRQRGSYATEVVVRDSQVAVLPEGTDLAAAACLPVAGITADLALATTTRPGGLEGGSVLVLGASGGVGHVAVQRARAAGARVVGVCSTRNTALVSRLGAIAIDYDGGDALVRAAAYGPFDVIVDTVGTAIYPVPAVGRLLAPGGRHVLLAPRPVDLPRLAAPSLTTLVALPTRERLEPLVRALADGSLSIVIAERYPLARAEEAQRRSRGGRVVGKLVLTVDASD